MNPQLTTLLLIVGGAGVATVSVFAALHSTFRKALGQARPATSTDNSSAYFGRIY